MAAVKSILGILARLSTIAGILMLAVSLMLRLQLVSPAQLTAWVDAVTPEATAGAPTGVPARQGTPQPTDSDVAASADPAPASPSPTDAIAQVLFADDFGDSSVWQVGEIAAGIRASYDRGSYVLAGPAVDLPVYVNAPQGGQSRDQVVTAELELGPNDGGAGVFLGDGETRVGAFAFADGRVVITRDSLVSLDVLGQGSTSLATDELRLELAIVGDKVSVRVNGEMVAAARVTLAVDAFGLGSWFQAGASAVSFDRLTIACELSMIRKVRVR